MVKAILFSVIAMFSSLFAFADNVKSFKTVDIDVVARVVVVEDEDYSINIRRLDENNPIIYEVDENNVLRIRYKYAPSRLEDIPQVLIKVTTPENVNIKVGRDLEVVNNKKDEKQIN